MGALNLLEIFVVFTFASWRKMPCYLFKGLVFAEEAMFLAYYGDLITYFIYHPNDQLFNAITMGFSQLVSLVKACQLSMFPLPDKLKLLGFHVSLFWRKIFRSFLTLHLFLSTCRWSCVCFGFLASLLGKFPEKKTSIDCWSSKWAFSGILANLGP